jgi:hypothetical protein
MKVIQQIGVLLGLVVLAAVGWGIIFGMMGDMGIGNSRPPIERKEKKE